MKKPWRLLIYISVLAVLVWLGFANTAWADTSTPAREAAPALTSAPATGLSYKIRVEEDGIYRITYSDLQAVGVPVDSLDPRTFRMWEQGSEIAIYVEGEADGSFDPGDAILFYGRMARTRYQDPNVYWLTYGDGFGLRMSTRDVSPAGAPLVDDYPRQIHLEENTEYMRGVPMEPGADHWFWDTYNAFECAPGGFCLATRVLTYTVDLPTLSPLPRTATVRPRVVGVSESIAINPDHHLEIYVNGTKVGDAYWDGKTTFTGEFTFSQSLLIAGTNTITFYVPLDIVSSEYGAVDWLEVDYYSLYQAEDDVSVFSIAETGDRRVEIPGFTSPNVLLLDITNPQQPVRLVNAAIAPSGGAYTLTFQDAVSNPDNAYIAAAEPAFLTPANIALDTPSDLKNPANGADWIVITHAAFRTQAEQLAAHRASFSGLRTMVVDVQDVYDEFSGGLLDPEAIRQFLAYARDNWTPPAPRYVVLFGDGNYDYKNYLWHPNQQFIPPYLDLVDCFLGETAADNRFVAGPRTGDRPGVLECQKHAMPYMAIGRLPANNEIEANTMVRRIICYENPNDPICAGLNEIPGWESRIIFVADDNDNAGAFTCHSDEVAGQQRCPEQDFGFRPASPRAAPRPPGGPPSIPRDLQPLAIVNPQVSDRAGFIGDLVWLDANGNGRFDAGESGIDGVIINLWEDVDNDGVLSAPDVLIATVQSGDNPNTPAIERGWYGFDGLDKANYLVEIDASNFAAGMPLEGMTLSAGQNPLPVHMDGIVPDEYTRNKIYLKDEAAPGIVPYPDGTSARTALIDAINNGAAFVTYNGHASMTSWAGEYIMLTSVINSLTNTGAWPVFLPMTCLEGQFQDIAGSGLSESLVRAVDSNGNPIGAVAAWAPTGLGVATGHTYIYTGFFEAIFQEGILTLGDAILYAKRKLYESDSLFKDLIETYTLFGDPAMQLRVLQPDLEVTKEVTPAGVVQPGDVLTYTITVRNTGAATAFDVTISDVLPSSLIPQSWQATGVPVTQVGSVPYVWQVSEIAPGESAIITVVVQVDPAVTPGTPVVNTVEVSSGSADVNTVNNQATVVSDVGSVYAVGGIVFVDSNTNSTYDTGETGISGVPVALYEGVNLVASVLSDASGVYTFTNVVPGTYTVQVTVPPGFVPTSSTSREITVVNASVLGVDFGFISPTAVTLANVWFEQARPGVWVRWMALDEQGILGYHLYRGRTASTPHRVTARPIPAQGGSKATYAVWDRPPADGEWYYWVEAVAANGATTRMGPFVASNVQSGRHIFLPWQLGR